MWFFQVKFILSALNVIAHTAAITLLYRDRNKRRNKHETYIISSLCLTELNGTLTGLLCRSHIESFSIDRAHALVVSSFVCQVNLSRYHYTVNNRSFFIVSFTHEIPDSMAL